LILKSGTSDSRKDWFTVGNYKKLPNEVGGMDTALPEEVADKMKELLSEYNSKEEKSLEDIFLWFGTFVYSNYLIVCLYRDFIVFRDRLTWRLPRVQFGSMLIRFCCCLDIINTTY